MATTTTARGVRTRATRWWDLGAFATLVWGGALLCALSISGAVDFAALDAAPGWAWVVLLFYGWVPALAALGAQRIAAGGARGFVSGWRWPAARWLLIAFAAPCVYTTAVAALTWATGAGELDLLAFTRAAEGALGDGWAPPGVVAACYAALTLFGGTLALSVFALGEELGWSGFVIPRLLPRLGIVRTALVTGALWSSYHFPLMLLVKNYTQGTSIWFTVIGLTFALIGVAFLTTWLRERSGSIWPAVLLHAAHNTLIFYLYEPLTRAQPATPYVGGEHGIGMMLVAVVLASLALRAAATTARANLARR
jgi:uncharacterized protein